MNISLIRAQILRMLVLFSLLIATSTLIAQTDIPAGNVSGIWARSGSPFRVNGDITIPNGQTLTIEPGVNVVFTGHYKFNVQGRLLAIGTEQDTITFTAQDTSAGWHSIRFQSTPSTNDTSKIIYCRLEYGKANTGNDYDRCGGAIFILNFSKVIISNCLIVFNMSSGNMDTTGGGGIGLLMASPLITNCEFNSNGSVFGTAMVVWASSNARIWNNHFHHHNGHGTVNIGDGSTPTLINNLFDHNTTPQHGIIHFSNASGKAALINNTIVYNTCSTGGVIYDDDASAPIFINNIIYGNTPAELNLNVSANLSFIQCLIKGGKDGFTGSTFTGVYQNCIDADPQFVDSNDFHLQNSSPCIGTGIDSVHISPKWYYAPAADFEGNSRPNPEGSLPDIGAFENASGSLMTGINEKQKIIPDGFRLYQNYPNPFNPTTKIGFSLPSAYRVRINVFNILGSEIATLFDGDAPAGFHEVEFTAGSLTSGIYFYTIKAGSFTQIKKMLLLR
jgi:hypothetical protein